MARVNVDDGIETDPRFRALVRKVGDEDRALGLLVRFWRTAQWYWGREQLVPRKQVDLGGFDAILEVDLAEERDGQIYARGSEKRFAWYRQKCRAAAKSADKRRQDPEPEPFEAVPLPLAAVGAPLNGTATEDQRSGNGEPTEDQRSGNGEGPPFQPLYSSLFTPLSNKTTPKTPSAEGASGMTKKACREMGRQAGVRIIKAWRSQAGPEGLGEVCWSVLQEKYPTWKQFTAAANAAHRTDDMPRFEANLYRDMAAIIQARQETAT